MKFYWRCECELSDEQWGTNTDTAENCSKHKDDFSALLQEHSNETKLIEWTIVYNMTKIKAKQ